MGKAKYIIPFILIHPVVTESQDVISRLEIIETGSLKREIVKEFKGRAEAPNWTPDGKFLVYNMEGLIYKIPVGGGEPELINTGSVANCNNDHVISSDGKLLCFSAMEGNSFRSLIYVVPVAGGEPTLVTSEGPSYLHGISPDNRELAYCASRNGQYDVYVVPVEGGEEIRLTSTEGLDDGPEYSPDGRFIWFNSVRTGLMQVWRMRSDGSGQTQMTFDEANNWFPHVSPDGQKVVFLTFRKGDVEPGNHPPYKQVSIRMIPASGGTPQTLVDLFGGQGTINVNSWSPDSRKIAFFSYELPE